MKNSKRRFPWSPGLALFFLAAAAGCSRGPKDMLQKKYPEGFSLRQPAGWEAQVADKKYILIAAPRTASDPAFVLVYPFFLKTPVDSLAWLKQNLPNFSPHFSQTAIEKESRVRPLPDESAVRFRFERDGKPGLGLALCSVQDRSGIVYIAGSAEESFEEEKPRLIAMLQSFRFEQPGPGGAGAVPRPAAEYAPWQDPQEGAFSLDVPRSWQVKGGTYRRASVDLVHVLHATSPDGRIQIKFNDSNIPIFAIPNQMMAFAGFREGSWYSPGYGVRFMVMRYLPGQAFLDDYLQRNYAPQLQGFQAVSRQDRPDIVQDFNRIYGSLQNYGISFTLHAGEEAFRFQQSGEPFVGYGLALTQVVNNAAIQGGNWTVALLIITTCPEPEVNTVREISTHMFQSLRMNPQWVASQQQLTANVSQIVTQTSQEISRIIDQSYWSRQGVMDDINRKFSNYILGVTDVADPETGETWKVESGHNYYWRRDFTNQITGTRTADRPDINFSLLKEF